MSSKDDDVNGEDDKWASTAAVYASQAARLTEFHGADLVAILKDDILREPTNSSSKSSSSIILEVGCGTGAFAKAYVQQFPRGVPGQTLILTDLSAAMLQIAKDTVKPPAASESDFQTKIVFQEEDGTKLEGIEDDSIDMVVSLFGVFLIPDQKATMSAIQRVLKKPNGIFANGSWLFNISHDLSKHGYGVSLQDAFRLVQEIAADPDKDKPDDAGILMWSEAHVVKTMLTDTYKFQSVHVHRAIHTSVWTVDALWGVMVTNPMIDIQGASEAVVQQAKDRLTSFVTNGDESTSSDQNQSPLMLSSASNLAVARGLQT